MGKISEWITNKPPIPALFSILIAIYPRYLPKYLAAIKDSRTIKGITIPHAKQWLFFYSHGKQVQKSIIQAIHDHLIDDNLKNSISSYCSEITRNHQDNNALGKFTLGILSSDIEEESNQVKATGVDDDDEFFTPEIIFLLKIIIPCWIIYRQHHTFLLRNARRGELDALDMLLRLDKAVIGDRLISDQFHKARSSNPRKFELMSKALIGSPKVRNQVQKVKTSLAGLISVVSEEFGHKFNAPEIKELFDAVAIDYGLDELMDPDLPDSPEAFSKAIQRERAFWQKSLR